MTTELQELLSSWNSFAFKIFIVIVLVVIAIYSFLYYQKLREYKNGSYFKNTELPFGTVRHDKGRFGEYLTYNYLKQYEKYGAEFLFNVYVPKENGETSEIDVLMIYNKGLFVFESKNYSGWIFGSENQRSWYQTLSRGKKESFYNPVKQNQSHIKNLKAFLGEDIKAYSIIVFSERCELKNVKIDSADIKVVKRGDVLSTVSDICSKIPEPILSEDKVKEIYDKLYPHSRADEALKEAHIADINNKYGKKDAVERINKSRETATDELNQNENDKPTPITSDKNGFDSSTDKTQAVEDKTAENVTVKNEVMENETAKDKTIENEVTKNEVIENEIATEDKELHCPLCGGKLILRTASRGANTGKQFYGCSNYPECRYIKNTESSV